MSTTTEVPDVLTKIEELTSRIDELSTLRRDRALLMREALKSHSRGAVATRARMSRHAVTDAVARLNAETSES